MLEDRMTLYTVVLVAIILIATISYNNMKAKEERQSGGSLAGAESSGEDEDATKWLSKFAVEGGSVVGETVSVAGDQLILKQAGFYKSIPIRKAKIEGDEVVVSGGIDWDAAMVAGAAWHEANTRGRDDAVTSQLTRSEDVRAPAREAMKEREIDAPRHPAGQSDDSEE